MTILASGVNLVGRAKMGIFGHVEGSFFGVMKVCRRGQCVWRLLGMKAVDKCFVCLTKGPVVSPVAKWARRVHQWLECAAIFAFGELFSLLLMSKVLELHKERVQCDPQGGPLLPCYKG